MFTIIVKTQREFIHRYKNAPEEVAFLRNYHRHMLHIEVELSVTHEERELEFFMVQRRVNKCLDECIKLQYVDSSCESVAQELADWLQDLYGTDREIAVKILEDGEVGGIYRV